VKCAHARTTDETDTRGGKQQATVAEAARGQRDPGEMKESQGDGGPGGETMQGSARAGESAQGRLATTWDGHTASAEAGAPPSCSVRVIKALDCGSGQYIVKEGVS